MRKQYAAANWKMNLTFQQAEQLLDTVLNQKPALKDNQYTLFAVPFPYLLMAIRAIDGAQNSFVAAQNCNDRESGAYTGEVSAEMLHSVGIKYCLVGHSERREYFGEDNQLLARKIDRCLQYGIQPVFCCGEPLKIRESGTQNAYVKTQLEESLYHLSSEQIQNVIIAYEPIWAIGTGRTASTEQAQEMHLFVRTLLSDQYGATVANAISILYGGSVKAGNAKELFDCPDVDGGLVGGASLVAADFVRIISSLK
jgi:triosephosphate isomerase